MFAGALLVLLVGISVVMGGKTKGPAGAAPGEVAGARWIKPPNKPQFPTMRQRRLAWETA